MRAADLYVYFNCNCTCIPNVQLYDDRVHTIIISRVARAACTVLVARQDDGQRDGRDGVLGQDGPDAAHESVGIPHDTSHARGHRQRARRRRDENLARKCIP